LFPVGYRNRFRHPHPDVAARYDAAHVRRLDSAASGAIDVRLTAAGTTVNAWRERRRRYWQYTPAG